MAGPWEKYGGPAAAPAAAAGPVYGPAPKPEAPRAPPAGYQSDGAGGLVPIPGGPADPNAKPDKPNLPAGWQMGPDGVAQRIPGMPTPKGVGGEMVPAAIATKAEADVGTFSSYNRSLNTFQDDFGGNLIGGLENTAQALAGDAVGTPGQRNWWADFYRTDNKVRNELFGATLTPSEQAAYLSTTISPRMEAGQIRENLKQRTKILEDALERKRTFMLENGYKPGAVDALFAPILEEQQALADAAKQEDDTGQAPPAFTSTPGVNSDGQVVGNDHNNGGSGSLQLAQGGETLRDNPVLAGVRQEYLARLGRGDSAESIIRWAREVGVNPRAFRSIGEQVRYRRANPNVALSEYNTAQLDDEVVQLNGAERMVNDLGQSAVGAGLIAAGNAASAFTLDEIVGATGGNAERARLGMDEVANRNPLANALGTLAGGVGMALGGEAALGMRGMAAGLPRAMLADSAYGAAAGAGGADGGNRLAGAGMGLVAGAGGSYLGAKTGNALAGLARGVSDPSVRTLQREGVTDMSIGQMVGNSGRVGQAIKSVEDRVAGLPIAGDMVNAQRQRGYRQFNARAFDKALEPIGATVGDAVGEEAVEKAQGAVSQAFRTALDGKGVTPDDVFEIDLTRAVNGVRSIKRVGEEVTDEIAAIMQPYGDEVMLSGDALDDISRNLRALKQAYRNDPLGVRVAKQVDRVERAVFDLFDRQASGTIEEYGKARQAYRRLAVLEDAVLAAKNKEGVFSTGQLGQADRRNSVKFDGRRGAARGEGVFHDYQRAAQNVLPNQVPDSGTVGRALVPLALIGAGGGADAATGGGVGTGLTIGTILAALYSKGGQRLLTKPARGMKPGTKRRAVLESDRTRRAIAATGAGSAVALTNQR